MPPYFESYGFYYFARSSYHRITTAMCPEPHVIFIVATQAEFDLHAPPSNRNLFNIAHLTGQDARCQPKVTLRLPLVTSAEGTAKAIEKISLTQEWVLTRLMENAERSLQHVAVLDKERKPTGEYRYDGSVANRALELLGKQQGMFIDRHEVGQPNEFANWTDEELRAFIKSGTEA